MQVTQQTNMPEIHAGFTRLKMPYPDPETEEGVMLYMCALGLYTQVFEYACKDCELVDESGEVDEFVFLEERGIDHGKLIDTACEMAVEEFNKQSDVWKHFETEFKEIDAAGGFDELKE